MMTLSVFVFLERFMEWCEQKNARGRSARGLRGNRDIFLDAPAADADTAEQYAGGPAGSPPPKQHRPCVCDKPYRLAPGNTSAASQWVGILSATAVHAFAWPAYG